MTWVVSALAVLACLALCLRADGLGRTLGLMDRPDAVRKLHAADTPLVGGLAVMVPTLVAGLILGDGSRTGFAVLAGGFLATVLGAVDDRRNVSAFGRLAALAVTEGLILLAAPGLTIDHLRLDLVGLELPLGLFAGAFTILVLTGFINAVNMADGVNGQFLGSILVWSLFLALEVAPPLRAVMLTLAACSAAALVFNLNGKLFSGSAGAYGAAMFLGLQVIDHYHLANGSFHAETPVFWFWLPVLDCLRLFVWRVVKRRSPFAADRGHLHHVLGRLAGERWAAPAYIALLAAPGLAALGSDVYGVAALVIAVLLYAAVLLAGVRFGREDQADVAASSGRAEPAE